jgi:hypothetical protein
MINKAFKQNFSCGLAWGWDWQSQLEENTFSKKEIISGPKNNVCDFKKIMKSLYITQHFMRKKLQ